MSVQFLFLKQKKVIKNEKRRELILICDDPDVQYDIPKLAKRISSELIGINEENGVWQLTLLAP